MVAKGRFAMRPGLTLREDYDAARLRGVARRTKSAAQGRRLLALAEIYDGGSRTKAACVGGVGLRTIRDWVLRFNAHGPEGLADRQAPGHPGKLNTAQRSQRREPQSSLAAVGRPLALGARCMLGVPAF